MNLFQFTFVDFVIFFLYFGAVSQDAYVLAIVSVINLTVATRTFFSKQESHIQTSKQMCQQLVSVARMFFSK